MAGRCFHDDMGGDPLVKEYSGLPVIFQPFGDSLRGAPPLPTLYVINLINVSILGVLGLFLFMIKVPLLVI